MNSNALRLFVVPSVFDLAISRRTHYNEPILRFAEKRTEFVPMSILNDSPHLAFLLLRRFAPEDVALLERAFDYSAENGGATELDFACREGSPCNPRLARIALILLNDARISSARVLASGLLAAAFETGISTEEAESLFPRDVVSLAKQALLSPEEFPLDQSDAAVVALVLRLDRARHIHLAQDPDIRDSWPVFLDESDCYLELAGRVSPPLYQLFSTWRRRFCLRVGSANRPSYAEFSAVG